MKTLVVSQKRVDRQTIYWTYYLHQMHEAQSLEALKKEIKQHYPFDIFEYLSDNQLEQQQLPLIFD